jgi:hypothetical protein
MVAFVVVVAVCAILGVWYELRNPSEYHYICANCGTVSKSFIPPMSQRKNLCLVCSHSQLISIVTHRGRELMEAYHGAASAHRHIRPVPEDAGKLSEKLEDAESQSGIADERAQKQAGQSDKAGR